LVSHYMKTTFTIWNRREVVRHSRGLQTFTFGDKHVSTA